MLRRVLVVSTLAVLLLALIGGAVAVGLKTRSVDQQMAGPQALRGGFQVDPTAVRVPLIVSGLTSSVVEVNAGSAGRSSTGTGIVISSDGLVLTNFHSISRASHTGRIAVQPVGQHENRSARLVGAIPAADLAVLKLNSAAGLAAAPLANSSRLLVGGEVVALGSPRALQTTTTAGAVTALHRLVIVSPSARGRGRPPAYQAIETDTAPGPTRSDGVLVDMRGHVIGMGSSAYRPVTGQPVVGQNFALPINDVRRLTAWTIAASG